MNDKAMRLVCGTCCGTRLSGIGEIECGDGSRRRFGPGDIMLADDTTSQGYITREIQGPRRGIFIRLPPEFDIRAWRGQ